MVLLGLKDLEETRAECLGVRVRENRHKVVALWSGESQPTSDADGVGEGRDSRRHGLDMSVVRVRILLEGVSVP